MTCLLDICGLSGSVGWSRLLRCAMLCGVSLCAFSLCVGSSAVAQVVNSIEPRSWVPGQITRLTLTGTELGSGLKLAASDPRLQLKLISAEPTTAVVEVEVPADMDLGPSAMWVSGTKGLLKQQVVLIDDLPAAVDNGQNHALENAQAIDALCSIAGTCEAAQSDFYRFYVAAPQRIAIEVHTQLLLSPMDPVVRLLGRDGELLYQADDDDSGPDCRFAYDLPAAGDYWLEVLDSRHAAAGAAYHLRVGDFPILTRAQPLAVQRGVTTQVELFGKQSESQVSTSHEPAAPLAQSSLHVTDLGTQRVYVSGRQAAGRSSAWWPVQVSQWPQVGVDKSSTALDLPVGISGCLSQPAQVDRWLVRGMKGQKISVLAQTRSLGSPAVLSMRLIDQAQAVVASNTIGDGDQWSMAVTFPADGEYRLEVEDLLKRGGPQYAYWLELAPPSGFSVALKGEAATREEFWVEPELGAVALDLTIERSEYKGPIEIALEDSQVPLRVLNPQIAADATAARIYLQASEGWQADELLAVRLRATAVEGGQQVSVGSFAMRRAKEPFILTPPAWKEGRVVLSGLASGEPLFAMSTATPNQFARPQQSHTAQLQLKRLVKDFKGNVDVLPQAWPAGWSAATKVDKDAYVVTVQSPADGQQVTSLPLQLFGEFNGRGRIENFELPIEWIDPVQATLQWDDPVVAGGPVRGRVSLMRQGSDPQPVTLKFSEYSAGLSGPESITLAADQQEQQVVFELAADVVWDKPPQVRLEASSKYRDREFTVNCLQQLPHPQAAPSQLEVYPTEIALRHAADRQQVVVAATTVEGLSRDWTRYAHFSIADASIAEVREGVIYPLADGHTQVTIRVGSAQVQVPVRVSEHATRRPIGFESEVLVALSKQGCNSGACHGSPSGKGGFRLSLRAFDVKLDELTLIREEFGRRINTLEPEQSLLLLKPLMKVAHGGGVQLRRSDEAYQVLQEWIAGGAPMDPPGSPRIVRLEVVPSRRQVQPLSAGGQQLAVTAHFSDNTRRDVTHLVAYESSSTEVASVDVHGFVKPHKRGEAAILVRYLEFIETIPMMFIDHRDDFEWKAPPANNYVDELVYAKLQQLQYLPTDTCSDAEFLRRVSLDVTGVLPTLEQTRAFLADPSQGKRSRLIDELLDSPEYAKFWSLKWGDLLKMTGKLVGDDGVYKYHRWIEQALRDNMPYDQFARQLLTASGSTLANPPANFYRTATDMNECVETISQVFMGARLQCAKCHNHPFERWTQDNYYGLGAFFNRVQRRKTDRPGELFVYTSFNGEVTQPRTGQVMEPWLPQAGSTKPPNDSDRRELFATWLVSPENPFFARIEANRIWSHFFARGIVDPIDDFRDSNPPSNAPLLDALASDFVEHGFDRQHLMRVILNSRTYQASYQTNDFNREDQLYFSHQAPRLLTAEQLLDAINRALGLSQSFSPLPAGTLATQLPAPDLVKVDFLKVFGQPERSTVCACERVDDSNLGMAIELFNGPMIHEKLRDGNNRFRQSLAAGKPLREVVEELYLSALCRLPTEQETQVAVEHCASAEDPAAGLEDICWALFNTDEFLFQH